MDNINRFVEEEAISQPIMNDIVSQLVERIKLSAKRDINSCYNELWGALKPHCGDHHPNFLVELICKYIGVDLFPEVPEKLLDK